MLIAVTALIAAGCTAGSRTEASTATIPTTRATQSAAAQTRSDPDRQLTIAVVTHGTPGDPFWDVVQTGAADAGAANDVHVDYQADPEAGGQAQLIDAATSSDVDGLVVSMADPDALRESITRAVEAGIPVVTINAGEERSAEFGALTHVGQSETSVGTGAGARLRRAGVTKVLCVIHESGNVGLEQRCQGAALGLAGDGSGGQTDVMTTMQVNASNIAVAETTIATELQADPDIDGVLTLNPAVAEAAAAAIESSGSGATLATFDLNSDVVQDIRSGQILFAVDQQQYLQGYLPVVFLALYARTGDVVGGGHPVPTGPRYITSDNVDSVDGLASKGTR